MLQEKLFAACGPLRGQGSTRRRVVRVRVVVGTYLWSCVAMGAWSKLEPSGAWIST